MSEAPLYRWMDCQVSGRTTDRGGSESCYHSNLGLRVIDWRLFACVCEREINYFTETCSGSEAGSCLRRIDLYITQI